MDNIIQSVIILMLLSNFALLIIRKAERLVRLTAIQGVLLTLLLLLMPTSQDYLYSLIFAAAVLSIKGICFPWLLMRTVRRVVLGIQVRPYLGNGAILVGILALVFSFWLERELPIAPGFFPFLLFPAAFTTIFTGFFMVVARRKAITQVIGYLAAENGIFLLGLPLLLAEGGSWFELVILLDVLVAVFVMGIAINHISSSFSSLQVSRFCSLKD